MTPAPATRQRATFGVIISATVMVLVDTTAVNIGLAQIGEALGAGTRVRWIVSAYLLAIITAQPLSGWMSNRFGRKEVFVGSLALFTAGSIGSAFAPTLAVLVCTRVLQGFGCGAIVPIGMAILLDTFPKERHGRTLATWGMASMVGPALGPTLGGYVITALSWHWVFLINVPIGIGATYFASRVIPAFPQRPSGPLDVLGLLCVTIGLSVTVLGLSEANRWGWSNPWTMACLTVGPLVMALFVWHVVHTDHPIFDIRVFRTRSFTLAMVITGSYFVGQTARLVFLPLSLQTLRGMTALGVGVLFLPAVIAQIGAFFVSGRLVDRLGRRVPVMIGSMLCVIGLVGMARLTVSTSLAVISLCVGLQAVGSAMCSPATMVAIADVPSDLMPHASAARALTQQVAGVAAVAVLGALVDARLVDGAGGAQAQSAYNAAFAVAALCAFAAFCLALFVKAKPLQHVGAGEDLAQPTLEVL